MTARLFLLSLLALTDAYHMPMVRAVAPSRSTAPAMVTSWYDSGKRLTPVGGVMDMNEVPADEERYGGARARAPLSRP